jgi:hypothetical protein
MRTSASFHALILAVWQSTTMNGVTLLVLTFVFNDKGTKGKNILAERKPRTKQTKKKRKKEMKTIISVARTLMSVMHRYLEFHAAQACL